jgi:hypothetical protein
VVGEQLERDGLQDRRDVLGQVGQVQHVLRLVVQRQIAVRGDGDHLAVGVPLGQGRERRAPSEDRAQGVGRLPDVVAQRAGAAHGQLLEDPAEVQGEEVQRGQLSREGLRRGHADLDPCAGVQDAVRLPRDGASQGVADGEGSRLAGLGRAEGRQGVRRLAGLGDDDDEGPVVED